MVVEKENTALLVNLPPLPGTYALVLRISACADILIGKLGMLRVQPGCYVYVGSALGPGGLASRVGRHATVEKGCRWHVDYLTAMGTLDEVWYTTDTLRRECLWAKALRQMRGATVPLERFGSSDCRCRSHLVCFQKRPSLRTFRQRLVGSIPRHGPIWTAKRRG